MSTKHTHFKTTSVQPPSEAPSLPADALLPPKTPIKRHFHDPPPSICANLSPLPFPPRPEVTSNDLLFTPFLEMCEIKTPLPRERPHLAVEADLEGLAITDRIIYESSAEESPNSYEDSSELEDDHPTPSESSPLEQEHNSQPSESHSSQESALAREASKARKSSKARGSVSAIQGTPSNGKRVQCNCRKSKCLKLYCDCFRLNLTCEGCNCVGCHNLEVYAEERSNAIMALMDRNPDPFGLKIEDQRHVKGCNCKKSGCLKKYCECYQAGLVCGDNCKCEDCKNTNNHHDHEEPQRPLARNTAKKQRRMVQI